MESYSILQIPRTQQPDGGPSKKNKRRNQEWKRSQCDEVLEDDSEVDEGSGADAIRRGTGAWLGGLDVALFAAPNLGSSSRRRTRAMKGAALVNPRRHAVGRGPASLDPEAGRRRRGGGRARKWKARWRRRRQRCGLSLGNGFLIFFGP